MTLQVEMKTEADDCRCQSAISEACLDQQMSDMNTLRNLMMKSFPYSVNRPFFFLLHDSTDLTSISGLSLFYKVLFFISCKASFVVNVFIEPSTSCSHLSLLSEVLCQEVNKITVCCKHGDSTKRKRKDTLFFSLTAACIYCMKTKVYFHLSFFYLIHKPL